MADVKIVLTAVDNASRTIQNVGGSTKNLFGSFTELSSVFGLVDRGLNTIKGAYDKVVGSTVSYAEEVRDLARALGTSSEESSKLIQIADDLKIPMASLEFGFRQALQKGVNPSIKGLKDLAKEYQAIEDPVGRAQFAMEKFGSRAGLQMQKVLELSTDQIDEMAESAERLGLVLDDKATKAAREYEIALDELSDAQQGFMVQTGTKVIPVITDLINAGLEHNRQLEEENKWYLRLPGVGTIYAAMLAKQAAEEREAGGAVEEHTEALGANAAELDRHEALLRDDADAAEGNKIAYGGLKDATERLNESLHKFSNELVFNKAAQNLDAEAALKLGVALGVVDTKTLLLNEALPGLTAKYDANKDGVIDASEATQGYIQSILRLTDAINNIPEQKTSTITVITKYEGKPVPLQHGIDFTVPGGFPNDSFFFPMALTSGERVRVGASSGGGGGTIVPSRGGDMGINIGELNVFASPGMDEDDLADAVIAKLNQAMRNARNSGYGYAGL